MRVAVDLDRTLVDGNDWLPGAVDALRWIARRHEVTIHTCRANYQEGILSVYGLLADAGLKHPKVTVWSAPGKPDADVYIDDKALRFRGDWDETIRELSAL